MNDAPATASRPINTLKGLLPFLKPHRQLLVFWLLALSLSSSATLFFPVAIKHLVDQGFSKNGDIDRWFLLLFGVASLLALATAARFYFVSLLGERVIADLRKQLYAHLIRLDQRFFHETRSGELISRLSADAELLRTVLGSSMSIALRSAITVIGSAVMMVITNPRLGAYVLIGIPLMVLPMVLSGRGVRGASKNSQDRLADANARASETFNAVHTVQSFVREGYETGRFTAAIDFALAAARKRIGLQSTLTAFAILIIFGGITLILWSGARSVVSGSMSAGTLTQFVFYAMIGAGSVGALAEVWAEVQRAAGGMSRIADLFKEQSALAVSAPAQAIDGRQPIRFEQVEFRYPSRPDDTALHDFSLEIRPGETVALVGPSGAGKSTVFQLLLRFYDPQQGVIRLGDAPLPALALADLRRQIAIVPQDPVIFGGSARDNIRYGNLDADDDAVKRACIAAEAWEFIQALPEGLDSELGEHGARLSGGQQQRIVIARALLKDAPILLLDEATSALDAQSERAVQVALEHLMQGRTTLVIAHRLATVLKADRIVVMDKGRVIATGTHQSLMAENGLYAELARLQFQQTEL
ncbi:ABC transporter transmembrane domain-containing protein [Arenimonas sp. GDDSR-1]|uniref:ABC transporter transmembrane domain-containing protein n=1 Tax=Arenimonas sp. GDDSR-1 TaxID=2950125 RepID=UPI00260B986E|nr:ABC transporter transmembrane domain-containing protein [Arenimonas sp. GDDSR-1]